MASRRKTINYRKIYEQHHGSIPNDAEGRTYDIHHIDGNHENNDPLNLRAIPITEHYDIHYAQGDYGACWFILLRMGKTTEELSEFASMQQLERVKNGTHHFLGGEIQHKRISDGTHNFLDSEYQRRNALKKVENGTHPFLDREKAKQRATKRVENGTHNFIGLNEERVKNGTHNFSRQNNPRFDHKIYTFKHKVTNEQVHLTGYDFSKQYNLSRSAVRRMINGFNKSVHGWELISTL